MSEPYSNTVRQLFADLRHSGNPEAGGDRTVSARAGQIAGGAEILLTAATFGDGIREIRFRAYGCPHLLAACEYCCRSVNGGSIAALRRLDCQEIMQTLAVPVQKTGSILLLVDAFASLAAKLDDIRH